MTNILLFGAAGMLGTRIAERIRCTPITRAEADVATITTDDVKRLIDQHQSTHIINCAAMTAVDDAEKHIDLADAVNGRAPGIIAAAAGDVPMVHISTDYVFDGTRGLYDETARTNPINIYGASKLRGEELALAAGARVFRVQWLYDTRGNNIFTLMKKLLVEKEALPIVADQWGAPTYTPHLADGIVANMGAAPGLYHLIPAGHTSRHGFVQAMQELLGTRCNLAPITSEEYPRPATRPKDTRLVSTKLQKLPHWMEGLRDACA